MLEEKIYSHDTFLHLGTKTLKGKQLGNILRPIKKELLNATESRLVSTNRSYVLHILKEVTEAETGD